MGNSIKRLSLLILFLLPAVVLAHDVTSADQETLNNGGLFSYIWVGAKHMLTGYDHLLFLVGVIFFLKGFKDILKFITVFTIGHSITLIAGTFLEIQVNEYVIDAIIALSVFYKGFENLEGFQKVFKTNSPNLLMMVFVFGLIHGLGLSTRLQSFDMGTDQLLLKIISFNVGVELGQIAALIPIVFLITKWQSRQSYPAFYKASNVYLLLAGVGLFVYQIYLYVNGG
ncbi:HupE/UreJ family protein [Marinirhabdus gelatinilytica]|uniref:HupE/UreJ protein n=1 Tax=Marinirhabdus gelatinilytica TaxID=1703343 RepID=A0A370QG57_9FLAO|nr:HupE/UreJ family protein [Marinirhabdus gelatinilytica]RDK87345.1 HupE/UreJ protein [Marinirhabdus gelatinilytica]